MTPLLAPSGWARVAGWAGLGGQFGRCLPLGLVGRLLRGSGVREGLKCWAGKRGARGWTEGIIPTVGAAEETGP